VAHDVFISYSSKDRTVADALCATLESQGIQCWIAPRNIAWGSDYGEAIVDGINESRAMVLVFSSHANASPHIKREVDRAVSKRVPIIPVRIEDVAPTRALEYYISPVHWLDAIPPVESHFLALAEKILPLVARAETGRAVVAPSAPIAPTASSPASPTAPPVAPAAAAVPPSPVATAGVPSVSAARAEAAAPTAPAVAPAADGSPATAASVDHRAEITPPPPRRLGLPFVLGGAAAAVALATALWLQPWNPGDRTRAEAVHRTRLDEERRLAAARERQLAEDERRRDEIKQAENTRRAAEEAAKRAEAAARQLEEARRADEARRARELEPPRRLQDRTAPVDPAPVARLDPSAAKAAVEQKLRGRGLLKQTGADRWGVLVEVSGDGVVTLTGVLQNADQRNETMRLAGEVPGVTGVKQQINVPQSWR
jgi:osmotically-inducible protein OsmY